jgi:hypothetical protein
MTSAGNMPLLVNPSPILCGGEIVARDLLETLDPVGVCGNQSEPVRI